MMKNMKKLALLLVLVLAVGTIFAGCSSKNEKNSEEKTTEATNDDAKESKEDDSNEKGVVRVATSGTYYPYTYMENDELVGFDIDIWEEIGKRIGRKVEWEITSFDGMFGMLDAGKVDAVAHQISITPKRQEKYTFSEIYAYNPYKMYVREDDDSITKLEDLYGKKFICGATGYEKEFIENFDKEGKIELVIASGIFAKEIELGRADASFHPIVNFESRMKEGGYKVKMVGDVLYEEENAYPFLKNADNKELIEEVNKAIKEMHEDGTLTKLSKERFGIDITKSAVED